MNKVNKIFLQLLSFDKENLKVFGFLPSCLKTLLYRLCGAYIGKGVILPRGTYIIAEYISIGDNSEFGKNCFFKAYELTIGKYAKFEETSIGFVGK
jgi:hypothetical protein